jgi:hypothetical protein
MGRGWAQDAGPVPRIHPHGSWHYARIVPVSTVTDRRVIGMVLKTKRRTDGKSGKSCLGAKAEVDGGEDASSAERRGRTPGRIVVQRLQDNEDGSKGAAEKAGTSPPPASLSIVDRVLSSCVVCAATHVGVRVGDELLEVNGETVHTLSKANAIITQSVTGSGGAAGPGDCIELVFSREQTQEQESRSAEHSTDPDQHDGASRRKRTSKGGCCGARPPRD